MKEIKKWTRRMQAEYALLWLTALAIAAAFECGWCEEGALLGRPRAEFALETTSILLTLGLIPTALRLFGRRVNALRDLPLRTALKAYHRRNLARLALLAIPIWGNLMLYYATMNSIGGLCALVSGIAALFCVPGTRRLMNELEITNNEEPNAM